MRGAALALDYARYSAPIVAANVLYLLIPLGNRAALARGYGFAETGQYSLAFDMGARIVAAVGTALDVLLFQMAVRADELHGAQEGRRQVADNIGVVLAVIAPACVGLWLVTPSLESLIAPAEYRGPFRAYFELLLPGFFFAGMINFAINPIFQIAKRTTPMIAAAAVACATDALLAWTRPTTPGDLALAQSGAMAAGLVTLLVFAAAGGARWPKLRDVALTVAGCAAMAACLAPLRDWPPGATTLACAIAAGAFIYGGVVLVFDIAGLRTRALVPGRRFAQRIRGKRLSSERPPGETIRLEPPGCAKL